jgi:hypothetical protein
MQGANPCPQHLIEGIEKMSKTGLNITLYTSKDELVNAKSGGSTLVASKTKTKDADFQIIVSIDACDLLETEVRVNLTLLKASVEEAAQEFGAAMGNEINRVLSQLE